MTEAAFLCLSAIFMTALASSYPVFVLERTPPKMTLGQGLSLECSSKGGGHDDLSSASWIRITKRIGRSWSKVAELRDFDSCVGVDQAAPGRDEVTAVGHLGNGDDTYLKLSWKSANLNVAGQYRCELVGQSGDGGIIVLSTPSVSVTGDATDDQTPDSAKLSSLGSKVDELLSLMRSIYERQTSLMQSVDRIQASLLSDGHPKDTLPQDGHSNDTPLQDGHSKDTPSQDSHSKEALSQDGHSNDTLSQDGHSKDPLSMDVHSKVVLLLRDQLANFSFENLKWNLTPPTAERYPDERSQFAESVTVTVSDVVVTPAPPLDLHEQWPGGSYALPVPETGCPENTSSVFWWETLSTHHVESDTEIPLALAVNRLAKPLYEIRGTNRFVFFRLCQASGRIADDNVWPKGAYCISRAGSLCPDGGFTSGYVQMDVENNQTQRMDSEVEADAALSEGVTRLHFCCRKDGDHSVPLNLPTQHPFYLYMYGGECQSVAGMRVTRETLIFDTEDEDNKDSYENDAHPDGRLNDVHIHLCYYENDVTQP